MALSGSQTDACVGTREGHKGSVAIKVFKKEKPALPLRGFFTGGREETAYYIFEVNVISLSRTSYIRKIKKKLRNKELY